MFPKQFRVEDEKVLEKVRGQGCCICGNHEVDASHIKTRGSGGPDTEWNVVAHCRLHHVEWGVSWSRFIRRYPQMAIVLKRLGWSWDDGKLTHPSLTPPTPHEAYFTPELAKEVQSYEKASRKNRSTSSR